MAYGTSNGVYNNLIDYSDLIENSAITDEMVCECRTHADGIVDARLAKAAPVAALPLADPPAIVNGISDDLTTYFVLRRLFTGKDPNDSEWVDKFYKRPLELLDVLVQNPEALGVSSVAEERIAGTTENQDRIFTVSRTSGGSPVSGPDDGSMDDW
jgi:hypothetical protein